jgi:hypothetical protein
MFNLTILDVAIGMIFIYLLLSLMCSAANEIIELLLKKRAIDLERGIRELLVPDTQSGTPDIVQKLYDHALVNNLFGGTYEESRIASALRRVLRTQLSSYIPARNFALALMDLVGTLPSAAGGPGVTPPAAAGVAPPAAPPVPPASEPVSGAAGATVARAPESPAQFVINVAPAAGGPAPPPAPPAAAPPPTPPGAAGNPLTPLRHAITSSPLLPEVSRRSLITLLDAAGDDVVKARENIENWYNSSMDRVSSWYKRRAQILILTIGLFIAAVVNADSITIAKRLSTDKSLRESLVAAADAYAKAHASPTPTPTPTPPPSDTTGTAPAPATLPPVCVKDEKSTECQRAKALQTACEDPNSVACKGMKALQKACEDPKSPACQREKDFQKACEDPKSEACRNAQAQKACEDENSSACQRAKDLKICEKQPESVECKRARDVQSACEDKEDSPKCKYLTTQQQIESLGLPIGWDDKKDPKRNWTGWTLAGDDGGWWDQVRWHWLGWLLTALAISLGAPFWFDLLNKFIVIRSAVKPHEKSPEEESKG